MSSISIEFGGKVYDLAELQRDVISRSTAELRAGGLSRSDAVEHRHELFTLRQTLRDPHDELVAQINAKKVEIEAKKAAVRRASTNKPVRQQELAGLVAEKQLIEQDMAAITAVIDQLEEALRELAIVDDKGDYLSTVPDDQFSTSDGENSDDDELLDRREYRELNEHLTVLRFPKSGVVYALYFPSYMGNPHEFNSQQGQSLIMIGQKQDNGELPLTAAHDLVVLLLHHTEDEQDGGIAENVAEAIVGYLIDGIDLTMDTVGLDTATQMSPRVQQWCVAHEEDLEVTHTSERFRRVLVPEGYRAIESTERICEPRYGFLVWLLSPEDQEDLLASLGLNEWPEDGLWPDSPQQSPQRDSRRDEQVNSNRSHTRDEWPSRPAATHPAQPVPVSSNDSSSDDEKPDEIPPEELIVDITNTVVVTHRDPSYKFTARVFKLEPGARVVADYHVNSLARYGTSRPNPDVRGTRCISIAEPCVIVVDEVKGFDPAEGMLDVANIIWTLDWQDGDHHLISGPIALSPEGMERATVSLNSSCFPRWPQYLGDESSITPVIRWDNQLVACLERHVKNTLREGVPSAKFLVGWVNPEQAKLHPPPPRDEQYDDRPQPTTRGQRDEQLSPPDEMTPAEADAIIRAAAVRESHRQATQRQQPHDDGGRYQRRDEPNGGNGGFRGSNDNSGRPQRRGARPRPTDRSR